jgi:PPOX class probable F420-dependent enzyme
MHRDMDWSQVGALLAPWRNYWVCTVTTDGSPHAAPVWGVVVDQVLWFYTEDDTVKARNLAADPRLVVHSESGDDVLIVRGTATAMGRPGGHPAVIDAFAAKYSAAGDAVYLPAATDVRNVLFTVSPTSALAWELDAYDDSQRRWVAPAEPTVSDESS